MNAVNLIALRPQQSIGQEPRRADNRRSACGRHTRGKVSPRQIRITVFQLRIFVTMSQLAAHTHVAALIFLILLDRTLASILIFDFSRGQSQSALLNNE